jgi:hypothetical protein
MLRIKCESGLCVREGSAQDNENMTPPSTFCHQHQVANIIARLSFEEGVPTFDHLMTPSKNNSTLTLGYSFRNQRKLYRIQIAEQVRDR